MAATSISITPQFGNNTVRVINCGTSSPRLGGTVDISAFPNLQEFRCDSNDITSLSGYAQNSNLRVVQFIDNKVTMSIPSLSGLTNLQEFSCRNNQLTGPIPSLSGLTNLTTFTCNQNNLSGPIPSLNGLTNLQELRLDNNKFTGSIPSLNSLTSLVLVRFNHNIGITGNIPSLSLLTNLESFYCIACNLTGPIPSLAANTALIDFRCDTQRESPKLNGSIPSLATNTQLKFFYAHNNNLSGFSGSSVSNTVGDFRAQNNQLNQSSVDAILSAFVVANRTTGTRILNVGGSGNAAPSYTEGTTTTSAGTNFTRSGTLVTANVTGHGHVTGKIVTINGITPTVFQGTFVVTRITDNQFQYTTLSSGTATGTGTATMRKTSDPTSGYASFQTLALVSQPEGPWTISINQP